MRKSFCESVESEADPLNFASVNFFSWLRYCWGHSCTTSFAEWHIFSSSSKYKQQQQAQTAAASTSSCSKYEQLQQARAAAASTSSCSKHEQLQQARAAAASTSSCSKHEQLQQAQAVRPLQINSLFPVLHSGIFACGRVVYFHYFIIRLAAFQAIIFLA